MAPLFPLMPQPPLRTQPRLPAYKLLRQVYRHYGVPLWLFNQIICTLILGSPTGAAQRPAIFHMDMGSLKISSTHGKLLTPKWWRIMLIVATSPCSIGNLLTQTEYLTITYPHSAAAAERTYETHPKQVFWHTSSLRTVGMKDTPSST